MLKKSDVARKQQVEHAQAERRILAALSHPFIVSLKFAFQTSDKLYIVTDYCQVPPTTHRFKPPARRRPPPPQSAVSHPAVCDPHSLILLVCDPPFLLLPVTDSRAHL